MNYMNNHLVGLGLGPVRTIIFDVGGRRHRVRELLMHQHRNTMIGQLGLQSIQDGIDEPIFIDRDGDIFVHVLNYLRNGEIYVPPYVPIQALVNELRYYEIDVKPGTVHPYVTPTIDLPNLALLALGGLYLMGNGVLEAAMKR